MESKEKPFVKLFHTIDYFYCYDVNTNSIIRINKETYHDIQKCLRGENVDALSINKLQGRGYLKPNDKNIKVQHSALSSIEQYMNGNLRQLILQVTQNCNLRCKYCVYSGSYINRTHTNKRMTFETAKKAVDFYFSHSTNKDVGIISFYGGEPLLEFELIQEIVAYCRKLYRGKNVRFNMTTNATLLTDAIVKYLYENDFNLTISLDGPQNVHDQSRVFADNHSGTFEKIMENLDEIGQKYPVYMNNISFNAVLDTSNDFQCSSNISLRFWIYNNMSI